MKHASDSSTVSSPRNAKAWGWDSPSCAPLWKPIMAPLRRRARLAEERDFISLYPLLTNMIVPDSLVFAIDDDASVRKGLTRLLRSARYQTEAFNSASDFLLRPPHPGPSCVIVDVRMPGVTGIELQEALIQRRREEQLIFITGHGDISMCAQAMKAGAVDFLSKPFRADELLQCVERALIRSAEQRRRSAEENEARTLLGLLTP